MSCQCQATTKLGLRCKNRTKNENKRCHLHQTPASVPSGASVPIFAAPVAAPVTTAPIAVPEPVTAIVPAVVRIPEPVRQIPEPMSVRSVQYVQACVPEPVKKKSKGKKKELPEPCSGKSDCCICMEEMPSSDKLDCGHGVCRSCLDHMRDNRCPMCRREISAKHIKKSDKLKMMKRKEEDRRERQMLATQNWVNSQFGIIIHINS